MKKAQFRGSGIFVFIITIIKIKSLWPHGVPWLSLAIRPYHSALPAFFLGYIICPHRAEVFAGRPSLVYPCVAVYNRMSFILASPAVPCVSCSSYLICNLFINIKDEVNRPFILSNKSIKLQLRNGGCPRGVMVKAMDCGIVVREFVFQLCYYVHFRENTLGKGMNPLILPAIG